MADSPFEIVTTKKSNKGSSKKIFIGLIVIVFLVLGILTGVFLVRQQQDIRESAEINCTERCPNPKDGYLYSCDPRELGGSPSTSQCDGRFVGRIEPCGGQTFCCNGTAWSTNMSACAVSTLTPTPTPTPTPKPTPTPTTTTVSLSGLQSTPTSTPTQPSPTATAGATKTPTPTPTSTHSGTGGTTPTKTPTPSPIPTQTQTSVATQIAQATKPPVPETGTGLPTIFAMTLGALVIIGSFVLAF
mgnify:CR=1 FL=1